MTHNQDECAQNKTPRELTNGDVVQNPMKKASKTDDEQNYLIN